MVIRDRVSSDDHQIAMLFVCIRSTRRPPERMDQGRNDGAVQPGGAWRCEYFKVTKEINDGLAELDDADAA